MVPTNAWLPLLENTIAQVKQGVIPIARIDDAVTRILRVKYRAGLFDKPSPAKRKFSGKTELIGSENHRKVARQAVRESMVLLKNNEGLLPLSPKLNILVAGDAANNIGKQSGGWTITWQGTNNLNSDFPGGSSIYDGFAQQVEAAGGEIELSENGTFVNKPDVAIVIYGEEPYAEGQGDIEHLAYQQGSQSDLALLKRLKAQGIPVVSIFISGRPMWVNAELNASDAFVAAWLPGSEGKAVADVLLTDNANNVQHDFKGKLSFSWPNSPVQIVNRFDTDYQPLLPYGFGLRYSEQSSLPDNLSEAFEVGQGLTQRSQSVPVFSGKVEQPWQMALTSVKNEVIINSNSLSLAGINYRTVDKEVQEDAFSIKLTGEVNAGLKFTAENGVQQLAALALSKELSMNIKTDSEVKGAVWISVPCFKEQTVKDNCRASYNIADKLSKIPQGQWQNISVSLACFTSQVIQTEKALVPLTIQSSSAVDLAISELHFNTLNNTSSVQCD